MREKLIAYANDFVSTLLSQREIIGKIRKIILFGSVARGDFHEKSDIDLFLDTKKDIKNIVKIKLNQFYASKRAREWKLMGVDRTISCKIGKLEDWKSLHRSIMSHGIILYGRYFSIPKKGLKHFVLISYKPIKDNKKRVKVLRKLYGYSQKIKGKTRKYKGIIERINAKRVSDRTLIVKIKDVGEIISLLKNNKVNYRLYEFWSDFL